MSLQGALFTLAPAELAVLSLYFPYRRKLSEMVAPQLALFSAEARHAFDSVAEHQNVLAGNRAILSAKQLVSILR